jgi:serine/threonine protein phosphatase PrpC
MEDAHTIQMAMTKHQNHGFFGVYDGHNGDVCAHWSAKNLWNFIDGVEEFAEPAIQKACLEADKEFLTNDPESFVLAVLTPSSLDFSEACIDQPLIVCYSQHHRARGSAGGGSGCTAVFVLADVSSADGYDLTVANIGDSRALIGRNGQTVALTEDHKPTNQGEMKRIQAAGGFVQAARVDGQLALSRAMGDSQYKTNTSLPADEQKVIPVPDVTKEKLKPGDFLLICCDGIFESFTNEQAVKFVHDKLQTSQDLAMIMAQLLDAVLAAGSKDNMTAVLILAEDGTSYHKDEDEFLPGVFHEHRTNSSFADAYVADARRQGYTLDQAIALLDKNAASGYYKPTPIQSRGGFLFPFFAAAGGAVQDDDEDDEAPAKASGAGSE